MKILYFVFSFYILSLLIYPCQENENTLCNDKTEETSDNHHQDHDCHTCPPFCNCNCCHVNTIIALKASVKTAAFMPGIIKFCYKEISLKEIILSIWQPPKA